tara:strand:- start:828 stop:1019 length:192 start_codon:yes stop_codon:yes gene_type:complete
MTDKNVTIEMDVLSAAVVRQILFDAQKEYSYEFAPPRITQVREVIKSIDGKIDDALEYDTSGK